MAKFTGKEQDTSTGLYFYAWRYYDPLLGRYTQPDTIIPSPTNPQSFNRYSYCDNNPINYTDPTGHKKFKDFWKQYGSTVLSVLAIIAAPFSGGLSLALWTASTVMGGVQAYQAGQFGAWAAGFAVSMVIGAVIPVQNFANPLMQVGVGAIRGAAIGAISGGIASAVAGGDFWRGAGQGAIGGAAGGGLSAFMTSQQFSNYKAGNGFVSNDTLKTQQPKTQEDLTTSYSSKSGEGGRKGGRQGGGKDPGKQPKPGIKPEPKPQPGPPWPGPLPPGYPGPDLDPPLGGWEPPGITPGT